MLKLLAVYSPAIYVCRCTEQNQDVKIYVLRLEYTSCENSFDMLLFTSTTVGKSKNIKEQNDQSYFLHRCFNYFGLYQSRWVNNFVYVYITNNFSIYLIFHNRSIEVLLFSSAYHKVLFNMSFKFALKCALTISKLPKNCYKKHYSP